jgi:ABC-type multidrug transport system ATPase subunit
MFTLEICGLHKHYGKHRALNGADLTVRPGEVYGLLGPNGAGKTTLMKTVLGLQRPTSGEIRLFGESYHPRLLTQVGALVEMPGLWPHMNTVEHLQVHARLRGISEQWIGRVLEQVQLHEVRDRRVANYSLGMRWRLGIAIALLGQPRFLVLDEPTNGLDPVGIREMRGLICSLAGSGITVLISSHQLAEIAQICNRVGVLVAGRTRYEGNLDGLAVDGNLEAGFFRILESIGSGVR